MDRGPDDGPEAGRCPGDNVRDLKHVERGRISGRWAQEKAMGPRLVSKDSYLVVPRGDEIHEVENLEVGAESPLEAAADGPWVGQAHVGADGWAMGSL